MASTAVRETIGPHKYLLASHGNKGQKYGLTSAGRKLVSAACDLQKKGEIFLKPSGKKGVFTVHTATFDHTPSKHRSSYRVICREIP